MTPAVRISVKTRPDFSRCGCCGSSWTMVHLQCITLGGENYPGVQSGLLSSECVIALQCAASSVGESQRSWAATAHKGQK